MGQQKAHELPFWPPEYSDTDIGNWLVLAWHQCHRHPEIKLPDKLGNEWAAKLAAIDPVRESGSITLAPLESALRKAIIDNDYAAAGRMVRACIVRDAALYAVGPVFRIGVGNKRAQSKRARNPRGDAELTRIVRGLAKRDATAKELWPALFSSLEGAGTRPEETAGSEPRQWRIDYTDDSDKGRHITLGAFERQLRRARSAH